jgi:hypothetical protein
MNVRRAVYMLFNAIREKGNDAIFFETPKHVDNKLAAWRRRVMILADEYIGIYI